MKNNKTRVEKTNIKENKKNVFDDQIEGRNSV